MPLGMSIVKSRLKEWGGVMYLFCISEAEGV
jgi:hypothetical protein